MLHTAIDDITQPILTEVLGRVFGDAEMSRITWRIEPVAYATVSPDSRGLFRLGGTADTRTGPTDWSLVLKVLHLSDGDANRMGDPTSSFYWKREALVYQSGLLADLRTGFVAPRCFGVMERPGNVVWLWLEAIHEPAGAPWPLSRFALAANHLGGFGGTFAAKASVLAQPWLSRGLIQAWVADSAYIIDCMADAGVWNHPLLRDTPFVAFVPAVRRLWDERAAWFAALEQLPQTLCHHDVWRKNLLSHTTEDGWEQTVAIDWEVAGIGAIGEDIGNLIGVSLLNGDVAASGATAFIAEMLDRYVQGLQAAGWRGDRRIVRAAAQTAAALRCVFSTAGWPAAIVRDPASSDRHIRDSEARWGCPIQEIFDRWAAVTAFLLAQADEARAVFQIE